MGVCVRCNQTGSWTTTDTLGRRWCPGCAGQAMVNDMPPRTPDRPATCGHDDPIFDATDGAHPAWWRGYDYGCKETWRELEKLLDGKDDGRGVCAEPWETIRRRLLALMAPRHCDQCVDGRCPGGIAGDPK